MFKRSRVLAVGLVVVGLALVGCGSDSDSSEDGAGAPTPSTSADASATTAPAGDSGGGLYGGGSGDTTAPSPASGGLTIEGFAFSPATVKAGEAFTITNADGTDHTVTADDDTFNVAAPASSTAELTIAAAGTYPIHCNIHSAMTGSITVE